MKVAWRGLPCFVVLFVVVAGCASNSPQSPPTISVIQFKSDEVGRLPPGFSTALTGGGGAVSWLVRADPSAPGGSRALVQESVDDTSYRFPLCVYDDVAARDVSAEVKFKTISGTVDQAGGIILRYRPENYYVARANALEDNINLFKTVNGNRVKIAEVAAKVTPGQWHTLGFQVRGKHLTVTFNGQTVINAEDSTFARGGKVGLWTKADSVTAFSDLRIEASR